ncbi:MAG: efflux RND transporter permease subunit, partial [Rhodospirillaceae bacterium]
MNVSELSIRRPVMTTLVMLGLVIFGLFAYRVLPVSELPNVDYPTIEVQASMPGASAETMAAAVATTLEGQFSRIAGVHNMTSISASGTSRVTMEFELDRDIDAAALDVQSAISSAMRALPDEMTDPPSFRKINPADFAVFYIGMSSETLPVSMVNEFAETMLAQRLSTISGVALVQIWGQQKFAVRAQMDPDALATRGISLDEVERAIRGGNTYRPTGALHGPDRAIAVKTTGQLNDAADYDRLIVAYRNGAPVRLSEIGTVINGVEATRVATFFGERQGIMLAIYRQPGSNTVKIVDQINGILPVFREQLPQSVTLEVMYDRAHSIKESIADVAFTLMLAAALVVLVIFLFLRNLAATLIASIALPISVIGTFSVMYLMGFSLNNLSLLALTLSVGFVVDDAIVMLENIIRHKERGLSTMQAALVGAKEISFTILSMTLSLVAVFIPVIFMGGMVGRLLYEFALTISATIIVSGVVSLMLTPMMCSRMILDHEPEQKSRLLALTERGFDAMLRGYDASLKWCLARKPLIMVMFVATIVGTWALYEAIQKDFLPVEDTGRLIIYTEGGQDVSFDAMKRYQKEIADIVTADPNIAASMSRVGAAGSRITNNSGLLFVRLKPRGARPDKDVNDVVQKLRRKLNRVAGIKAFVRNPPAIRVGGRLTNAQYQYTLQDLDLESLYKWADIMASEIRNMPGFQDVTTDLKVHSPSLVVNIDRDRAGTMGIKADDIESTLANAFGGRKISTIYTAANQYAVILEVAPQFQQDPEALKKLYVRAPGDRLVPMNALATFNRGVSALTISHQGQIPAVTISFNLAPDVSLGTAIDRVHELERNIQLPATLTSSFQGTAQVFQQSLRGMGLLLTLAILVVYIVLGILYESFIHPLTILSGLPAAGVGALLALMAFGMPLTLYGFVGVIMLVGIVKKNAIMMIDFA